jgi:hypothetical protein
MTQTNKPTILTHFTFPIKTIQTISCRGSIHLPVWLPDQPEVENPALSGDSYTISNTWWPQYRIASCGVSKDCWFVGLCHVIGFFFITLWVLRRWWWWWIRITALWIRMSCSIPSFLENSISHSVQIVDIVETMFVTPTTSLVRVTRIGV